MERWRSDLAGSAVAGQAVEAAGMPAGVFAVVDYAGSGRATGGAGTTGPGRSQAWNRCGHSSRAPSKAVSASRSSCCAGGPELVAGADSLQGWCRWAPAGLCKRPFCRLAAIGFRSSKTKISMPQVEPGGGEGGARTWAEFCRIRQVPSWPPSTQVRPVLASGFSVAPKKKSSVPETRRGQDRPW